MSKPINYVADVKYISGISYVKPGAITEDSNGDKLDPPVLYGYSLKVEITYDVDFIDEFTGEKDSKQVTKILRFKSAHKTDSEEAKNSFLACRALLKYMKEKKKPFQVPIIDLNYKQATSSLNHDQFIAKFSKLDIRQSKAS